jgi:hypothetical protein
MESGHSSSPAAAHPAAVGTRIAGRCSWTKTELTLVDHWKSKNNVISAEVLDEDFGRDGAAF